MSGFAGFKVLGGHSLPLDEHTRLMAVLGKLSRNPRHRIDLIQREDAALAGFDPQPDAHPASSERSGFIAGDPVMAPDGATAAHSPGDNRAMLLSAFDDKGVAALEDSKGLFAAAVMDGDGNIQLAVDRFGVHSLFVHTSPNLIVFATSLRVLLTLLGGRARLVPEEAASLLMLRELVGRQSLYRDVERLRGGDLLKIGRQGAERSCWWRPPAEINTSLSYEDACDTIRERFIRAVQRRALTEPEVAALSGGLDSRLNVAALRALGRSVWTFTMASPGFADHLLSIEAAAKLETRHSVYAADMNATFVDALFAGAGAQNDSHFPPPLRCRRRFFAGNGGGVLVGHIRMTETSVRQHAETSAEALAHEHAAALSTDVLFAMPGVDEAQARRTIRAALEAEYREGERVAPERREFHFLMRNREARHLHSFLEDADLYDTELALPFFDADLVEAIYRTPIDFMLLHRLYNDLVGRVHSAADSVPWQAYPGHLPSPVPMPGSIVTQWSRVRRPPPGYRPQRLRVLAALARPGTRAALGISRRMLLLAAGRLAVRRNRRDWKVEKLARLARMAALIDERPNFVLPAEQLEVHSPTGE